MPKRRPTAVAAYLATLAPAVREEVARVRDLVAAHIGPGFEEVAEGGMIAWRVPLARYADTYNGKPLWYAALAPRKNYLTLHLMPVYGSTKALATLQAGFKAAGKKLDIGKACIRFRAADDLALDAVAAVVASCSLEQWTAIAMAAHRR